MDNSEASDANGIKSTLFPLDKIEAFEARLDESSNCKPYKPPIFDTQIHYGHKSNFTPVATPLKGAPHFGMESVLKSPLVDQEHRRAKAYNIGTPTYEVGLADAEAVREARPIFESTVKPLFTNNLRTFSGAMDADFGIDFDTKATTEAAEPVLKPVEKKDESAVAVNGSNVHMPPMSKIGCNCKNSQCLKLYCDCFRNQRLCKNCSCVNCHNKSSNAARRHAIATVKAKNPSAFDPRFRTTKIVAHNDVAEQRASRMAIIVARGCKCKNSNCQKKYCECYQYGLSCSEKCQCENCENNKVKLSVADMVRGMQVVGSEDLVKRDDFDVRAELRKKLLEIKKFKLGSEYFN